LTELYVDNCGGLYSKESISHVFSNCSLLSEVHLSGCTQFTSIELLSLLVLLSNRLKILSIANHPSITDLWVTKVIEQSVTLLRIDIRGCAARHRDEMLLLTKNKTVSKTLTTRDLLLESFKRILF
jgi:hypothetical protein